MNNYLSISHWLSLLAVFMATLAPLMIANRKKSCEYEKGFVHGRKFTQSVLISLLITYILFILLITLIARTPADTANINLIPFWSWREVIFNNNKVILEEIILNVLLFVPVGVLFCLLEARGKFGINWINVFTFRHCILFCLIFSIGIELTQYFSCLGFCEWDDVVHNMIGGVVGWYLGRVILKMGSRKA